MEAFINLANISYFSFPIWESQVSTVPSLELGNSTTLKAMFFEEIEFVNESISFSNEDRIIRIEGWSSGELDSVEGSILLILSREVPRFA